MFATQQRKHALKESERGGDSPKANPPVHMKRRRSPWSVVLMRLRLMNPKLLASLVFVAIVTLFLLMPTTPNRQSVVPQPLKSSTSIHEQLDADSPWSELTFFSLLMNMDESLFDEDKEAFVHQWNAISSWRALVPSEQIIIFAADQYSCDYISRHMAGVQCVLDIPCIDPKERKTDMSCVWTQAHALSSTEQMVFVNADIVLLDDFMQAIINLRNRDMDFVMVGQRTDVRVDDMIKFEDSGTAVRELYARAVKEGTYHGEWGLDYFVHTRTQFRELIDFPPFLAGVYRWDNWLLSEFVVEASVTVVDSTLAVRAVHQEDSKRGSHQHRRGAEYNDKLTKKRSAFQYKIGNVYFADQVLDRACGNAFGETAECELLENLERDLDLIALFRRMSDDLNLAVLTVNSGYLDMAMNWLCWARRIEFTNFVILAEDMTSYRAMRKEGVDVVVSGNAPETKAAFEYGSKEFQDTMMYRTRFLFKVLYHGINFMTADIDTVWMDDPFKYVDSKAVVQGQQHKVTKISGGLVYILSTPIGVDFWKAVIACQEANIEFLNTHEKGTYTPSSYDEQHCINELSASWEKKEKLSRYLLLSNRFSDGKAFFDEQQAFKQGLWPVVIHNNWIVGYENKVKRFKEFGLWAVDDQLRCERPPAAQLPAYKDKEPEVTIRVLAFDRPTSMIRLLNSLRNARYGSDRVSLVVSIDSAVNGTSEETLQKRKATVKAAHAFSWPYGEYAIEDLTTHRGLVGQWTESWTPSSDSEFLVVFEDDLEVSKHWFIWTKAALREYYYNADNYDPDMLGISLQSQYTILGESVEHKYGEGSPASILPSSELLYKYQLVGTWGTVLFPKQWSQFVSWYSTQKDTQPCVPNMLSNSWWLQKPHKVWSQWIARYAFESGAYWLYTNFAGEMAFTCNHREAGENFSEKRGATNDIVQSITPAELVFPPLETIRLFDFTFNDVTKVKDTLRYRSQLSGSFPRCWTQADYRKELKNGTK